MKTYRTYRRGSHRIRWKRTRRWGIDETRRDELLASLCSVTNVTSELANEYDVSRAHQSNPAVYWRFSFFPVLHRSWYNVEPDGGIEKVRYWGSTDGCRWPTLDHFINNRSALCHYCWTAWKRWHSRDIEKSLYELNVMILSDYILSRPYPYIQSSSVRLSYKFEKEIHTEMCYNDVAWNNFFNRWWNAWLHFLFV